MSEPIIQKAAGANTEAYSRARPFWANVIRHFSLTKPGSLKDTRHFVMDLQGSGLTYTPGDSLGAFGANDPALVNEIGSLLGFDLEYPLRSINGSSKVLREAFTRDYILNRANRKIVSAIGERLPQGEQRNRLMEILDNHELLS